MHNIEYRDCPENCNRQHVKRELDSYVAQEDYQENCPGLYNPIRWLEGTVCEDKDAAVQYISSHDKGDYDNLAVRYHERKQPKETVALAKLRERYRLAMEKYQTFQDTNDASTLQSAYLGCKGCGSRLATAYLKKNSCPVCGHDLRPASQQEKVAKMVAHIRGLKNEIQKEEEKARQNAEKTGKIFWLLKFEYHT